MNIIRQCEFQIDIEDKGRVTGFGIDRLKSEIADEIYGLFLKGNVTVSVKGLKRIEFYYGNRKLDRARLKKKKGLTDKLSAKSSGRKNFEFELALNLAGAPATGKIEIYAVFGPGDSARLGYIHIERKPIKPDYVPVYNPIILNSMGRSGTTWFMHYLGEHPNIYIHEEYPHELLAAHYWINLLESLTTPVAADRMKSKWQMRDHQMKSVRSHAYYRLGITPAGARYLGADYVEELAGFCQRSIDNFYRSLILNEDVKIKGSGHREISYFSEKSLPFPELLKEIYTGAKEIFLVRDVRDNICSALAFNKKRGTQEFGRGATGSDEEFAIYRSREFKALHDYYQLNKDNACLVRYEDLVLEPVTTMQEVITYLELDNGNEVIKSMLDRATRPDNKLSFHKTSSSSDLSVQRWKSELPEAMQKKCIDMVGGELESLGYMK